MAEISRELEDALVNISRALQDHPRAQQTANDYLKNIAEGLKPGSTRGIHAAAQESSETAARNIRGLGKEAQSTAAAAADLEEAFGDVARQAGGFGDMFGGVIDQTGQFGRSLYRMEASISGVTETLSQLPLLGGVFGTFAGLAYLIDDTVENFRTLTTAMVRFEGGMIEAQAMAGEMGISLQEFAQLSNRYAGVINQLGVSGFANLLSNVKDTSSVMSDLGLTVSETAEFLGSYLERERQLRGLRAVNEQELRNQFESTLDAAANIASMTGRTLQETMEQFSKQVTDPDLANVMASLPQQAQEAFTGLLSVAPEMQDMLLAQATYGGIQFAEQFRHIIPAGIADDMQNLFDRMESGSLTAEESLEEFAAVAGQLSAQQINDLRRLDPAMATFLSRIRMAGNTVRELTEEERERIKQQQVLDSALLEFNETIRNVIGDVKSTFLQYLFGPLESDQFAENITDFQEALDGVRARLTATFSDLFGPDGLGWFGTGEGKAAYGGLVDTIEWLGTTAMEYLHDFFDWFNDPETKQGIQDTYERFKSVIDKVASGIEGLSEFFSENGRLATVLIAGIGALFIAGPVIAGVTSAITSLFLSRAVVSALSSGVGKLLGSAGGRAAARGAGTATGARGLARGAGNLLRRFGPLAGLFALGDTALELGSINRQVGSGEMTATEATEQRSGAVAGGAGTVAGGVIGGALGSVLGPAGTLGGAALGSWLGNMLGEAAGEAGARLFGAGDDPNEETSVAVPIPALPEETERLTDSQESLSNTIQSLETNLVAALRELTEEERALLRELQNQRQETRAESPAGPGIPSGTITGEERRWRQMMEELRRENAALLKVLSDIHKENKTSNRLLEGTK